MNTIRRDLMKKQFIFALVVALGFYAISTVQAQDSSLVEKIQSTIASYTPRFIKIPGQDMKAMSQWVYKKINRQPISDTLDRHAKTAFKRTGIPILAVLASVVVYKLYKASLNAKLLTTIMDDKFKKAKLLIDQGADVMNMVPLL